MARTKLYDLPPTDQTAQPPTQEPLADGELSDDDLAAISGGAMFNRSLPAVQTTLKSTSLGSLYKGFDPYAMG